MKWLLLFIAFPCSAHVFNQSECKGISRDAIRFAEAFRAKTPMESAIKMTVGGLQAARENPASYVKDDEDIQTAVNLLQEIYRTGMTPGQAYDATWSSCMVAYDKQGGM